MTAHPDSENGDPTQGSLLPGRVHDLGDGSEQVLTALYRTHWMPMVRLAAVLTGDASVAEEIVQESFIRLHGRWGHLRDPQAAVGYLRTSVVNGSRSALRHRGVVQRLRPVAPDDEPGPEDAALRAVRDAEVVRAVRALPRRQREVVLLRYLGDLTEREIAEALGISAGSVKSHASRGLAALRTVLAERPGRDATYEPRKGDEHA